MGKLSKSEMRALVPLSDEKLLAMGKETTEKALEFAEKTAVWTKGKFSDGVQVYNYQHSGRYAYQVHVEVKGPADVLYRAFMDDLEGTPKWMKMLKEVQIISSAATDQHLVRQVTASAAMGMVSSREFIVFESTAKASDGRYYMAYQSVENTIPVEGKNVRGEAFPCIIIIAPKAGTTETVDFHWYVDMDYQMNALGQKMIDQVMDFMMLGYGKDVKAFAAKLK